MKFFYQVNLNYSIVFSCKYVGHPNESDIAVITYHLKRKMTAHDSKKDTEN